ncbi:hypothetical protein GRJ2_001955200 [Grus japonensis]|uniref:Uncharacterized protein n=1 Tax=Grus japonensis TaxID=30415 RepID=A0ABC9XBJ6_GRUJA
MSPSRKEMAGQEAGAPAWDGESDDFPVKSRGYPCCQQKAHAEEEGGSVTSQFGGSLSDLRTEAAGKESIERIRCLLVRNPRSLHKPHQWLRNSRASEGFSIWSGTQRLQDVTSLVVFYWRAVLRKNCGSWNFTVDFTGFLEYFPLETAIALCPGRAEAEGAGAPALKVTDFLIRPVKKKKCPVGGNACTLNVFIVECSSVPYIMV